ncbi:hypothetical protein [Eubacterium sp. An3]|uniref:hypothetical protein n=1 Tax=Eubacterium sp. An3 TaxID=1965628 RepID=UPI000B3A13EF|nr:hypothetical protein [Eubacterium sp. An3]OUO25103.1 hypothetical protein B5F87_18270 [Eubacterium sp. An3]
MYLKQLFKFLSTITCCLILFFSSFSAYAYEKVSTTEIEYLDDGTYFEITIEEIPSIARASTITGKKTATQKAANGTVLWSVTVTGTFSYNGKTAKCTKATDSVTSPGPYWSIASSSASKSGATAKATATAKKTVNGRVTQKVTKTIKLTCSPSGKLS